MKLAAFSCRDDEREFFELYAKKYGVELVMTERAPSMKTVHLAEGCQAVSIITTPVEGELLDKLYEYGVKVISTRTIGFEHVDYERAASLGITVSNVSYTPYTVAEYTVMSTLMALRKMKTILNRYLGQDYGLKDVRGTELHPLTIGVVGTGRIGVTVIQILHGFGCRILAYDLCEKETVKTQASYVPLEDIWTKCDVITFHAPATEETYHMVDAESIAKMKDGVVLVNTARGTLIDTDALIDGLESGKIGAAALDVVEDEGKIYYKDFKYQVVGHRQMAVLNAMPNVLMTPHTAFFTDQAVSDMVEFSVKSCLDTLESRENPWKVNGA